MTDHHWSSGIFRICGVLLAIGVASMLFWFRIRADAETSLRRQKSIIEIQQTYRHQAALLTCWDVAGFFGIQHAVPATTRFILPLPLRDDRFNLAAMDNIIREKQCKIDTTPQFLDYALHEWLQTHTHIDRVSAQVYAAEDHQAE